MIEPVENGAPWSFRLRPISAGKRGPPRRFRRAVADILPGVIRELSFEHKTPAIAFGIRRVAGRADEVAELHIADGVAGDREGRERHPSRRTFAVFRKAAVVRSH